MIDAKRTGAVAAVVLLLLLAAMPSSPAGLRAQPIAPPDAPPPPPPSAPAAATQPDIPRNAQPWLDTIRQLRPGPVDPADRDGLMEYSMRLNRVQEAISFLRNNFPQVAARPEVRIGEMVALFELAYLQDDAEMRELRAVIARALADPAAPRPVRAQAQYYELNAELARRRKADPPTSPDQLPPWVYQELDRRVAFARQYKDLEIGRQAFAEAIVFRVQVDGYARTAPLLEQFVESFPDDRAAHAGLLAQLMTEQYATRRDGWPAAKPLADRLLEEYRDLPVARGALADLAARRLEVEPDGGMEMVWMLTAQFPGDEAVAHLWGRLLATAHATGDQALIAERMKVLDEKFPRTQARARVRAALIYDAYTRQGLEAALPELRKFEADSPQSEMLPSLMAGIAIDELTKGGYAAAGPFVEDVLAKHADTDPGRDLARVARRYKTVGQPFPPLRFKSLEGVAMDTAVLRDRVVVIHFWATWSPPSTAGMARVIQLANEMRPRGVVFVGVNMDSSRDVVIDYIRGRRTPMPWVNSFDVKGRSNDLAVEWGILDLPYFLVIDRQGRLVNAGTGDRDELARLLGRLTAPPGR